MAGLAENGMRDCGPDIAKATGIMFMSRTYAHMAHLKTRSYAAHKALDEFYNEIVDLADEFIEAGQGMYGILDIPFVNISGNISNPIDGLTSHLKQLNQVTANIDEDYLQNILQEIEKLYRSTLYKLTNLS